MRIAIIHGPNLRLLGQREPEVYGTETLGDINQAAEALGKELGVEVEFFQSNSEGEILDFLEEASGRVDGFLVKPGGTDPHERSAARRLGQRRQTLRRTPPLQHGRSRAIPPSFVLGARGRRGGSWFWIPELSSSAQGPRGSHRRPVTRADLHRLTRRHGLHR